MQVKLLGSNKNTDKKLVGIYTQLHSSNEGQYGNLPNIMDTICESWMPFSGHCWRSKEEAVQQFIIWNPNYGGKIKV